MIRQKNKKNDAGRTLVPEDGHIVQEGRHADLIQTEGVYKTLCSLQIE